MEETPDLTAVPQEPAPAAPARPRRWPLGALSIVVIGFVAAGMIFLGGGNEPTAPTLPQLGSFPTATGDEAPDFTIELLDGTTFRLSTHLADDGRPVLLNLWASWCTPCREEMPALDAAATAHPDVYFLGVAVEDDPTAAANFAAEVGVGYALAIDEAERVGSRYLSPGLPATFFISADGRIVKTVFGAVDEAEVDAFIAEAFGL